MSDIGSSGIFVVESLAQGEAIPADRGTVTAFVGPTPRGPVDRPIEINGIDEFRKYFGFPGYHCRMEQAVQQFLGNGGRSVCVVRVSGTMARNRICLPGEQGTLILHALSPGPLEILRASVDYDAIPEDDLSRFNLVIQRLRSSAAPLIEQQEIYRGVSVNSDDERYVGYALARSELVHIWEQLPLQRPSPTVSTDALGAVTYISCEIDDRPVPAPSDYDLVGSQGDGTGLFALDQLAEVDLVYLLSGSGEQEIRSVGLVAADKYCRERQALLLVDPPNSWQSVDDVVNWQQQVGLSSPNLVTYFPCLRGTAEQGATIPVSMAGAIAGVFIAQETMQGRWSSSVNFPLILRASFQPACELTEADVRALARVGVNSLVTVGHGKLRLCGQVTQSRFGSLACEWDTLWLRRNALYMLGTIKRSTRWTAFKENNVELWSELRNQLAPFLATLFAKGALVGESATESFYIKCDADTNAGLVGKTGQVAFVVGLPLQSPGQFLAFRFVHRSNACTVTELGWQPGLALAS